jgi:catalase
MKSSLLLLGFAGYAAASQCPFAGLSSSSIPASLALYSNDTDSYMTSDWGTPIQDQLSLKVGPRGPTALEDFMFRQKLQRFDHERVS